MTTSRSLDFSERWLRDGLEVCRPAAFFQILDIDMSRQKALTERAKLNGLRITYTHLIVRAVALTLAAHPDLHTLVCGNRVHRPSTIDIGLSVAGETFVAPVLVLSNAGGKDVATLAEEIRTRVPTVQSDDRRMLAVLRKWGWVVPLGSLRRILLRTMFRSFTFRRQGSGTFQVSVMANLDQMITPVFSTTAILAAGRVQDRVIAVNGVPAVRPTIRITLSADHRVWDGRAGERFLLTLQEILTSSRLEEEVLGSPADLAQIAVA